MPISNVSHRWIRGWFGKLLLVVFSLFFSLVIAEAGLRVVGINNPVFTGPDSVLGIWHRAGVEGRFSLEGGSYVRINGDGLRDREHQRDRPPNTIRIAVLGDSYAEAFQVAQEKAFWAVAEDELNRRRAAGSPKVEMINFGIAGFGTAQELLTFRHRASVYRPDFVLLAFLTGNDVRNNSRILNREELPYFRLRGDDLVLDNDFLNSTWYKSRTSVLGRLQFFFADHLRLVQVANNAKNVLRSPEPTSRAANGGSVEAGLDDVVYTEPKDANWVEAWAVTERLIYQLNSEVGEAGARLLVATLSNGIQVNPDANTRAEFMKRVGAPDLFYPDHRVRAVCQSARIPVINLAEPLSEKAKTTGTFFHGFGNNLGLGHWNENGHRAAGEIIASWLTPLLAGLHGS
jgi:hypothetical protein